MAEQLDREKIIAYLLGEIEHPQCYSAKCVCLNLKQKIEYGDFDCNQGYSFLSEALNEGDGVYRP